MTVTFGQLGATWAEALWHDAHGNSIAMCEPCWQVTRQAAEAHLPDLTIHDLAAPAAGRWQAER
jgi:hypothetical protein